MSKAGANTHATRALVELRERILTGEFGVGMRLYEVPVAEQLKISRTPVRDAFGRLAEEGLLDRLPGGGYAVRTFSVEDVIDAIELRGVLEGMAARLAAERGPDPHKLETMQKIVIAIDGCFSGEDVNIGRYSELNSDFHEALAGLAGSRTIQREIERATKLPFASPAAFLPENARYFPQTHSFRSAQEQHRALVVAIEAREGTRADAIAREHARIARHNLEYVLGEDVNFDQPLPGLALIVN
ncbi:MAG: GntR family transcriptional regulator [Rhizobiales bacterium]|nr:GntR family transcriptional regulator [Hyphomicrobiales bacterium]